MLERKSTDFTPPHEKPASRINRYFESLMQLTYDNPLLVRGLIKVAGIASLALIASPFAAAALGYAPSLLAGGTVVAAGLSGAALSRLSWFMQNKFYGLPIKNDEEIYHPAKLVYQSAQAEIVIEKNHMPRLVIKADNSYDAGYAEGYILGDAIRSNVESTNFLYRTMWWMGAPWFKSNIAAYLNHVMDIIPESYRNEMRGKVAGYNQWLHDQHIENEDLDLHYYLLLQLLPDIRNYNPFGKGSNAAAAASDMATPACTTIALRMGDYTFFTRVLDWPAYNIAGKAFIQVDRQIGNVKRWVDIGFPLLSGALTCLNEDGLLLEMNVAHGDKVVKPEGLPAVFFNRFCIENAAKVDDLNNIVANHKPLAAYHLTASDGKKTESYHFYQSKDVRGEHVVDKLDEDKTSPQLLVVANHGLEYHESGSTTVVNHRDSNERKQNIHKLFSQKSVQEKFAGMIEKQKQNQKLSSDDILELKEFCLQVARLPLICNCSSVLCALYVYHHDELIDVSAATDNLYAQKQELYQFKSLMNPSR